MNTSHLKYFYDVYKLESVIDAARVNNVAPSTISQAIRALENDLGLTLTSKKRGQLQLSDKAVILAQKIPAILLQVEEIRSLRTIKSTELEGQLRIATHQSLLSSHLWSPIRTFKKRYPKVELSLFTGVGPHLVNMLGQQQVDVIITLEHPGRGTSLKSTLLHEGSFVLAGQSHVPFNKKSPIAVTSKSKIEVQQLLKNNPWMQIEELTNWSTIKNVILNEEMFGYLPDYLIQKELKQHELSKVTKIKKQDFKFQISSWYSRENSINEIVTKFNLLAAESFKTVSNRTVVK